MKNKFNYVDETVIRKAQHGDVDAFSSIYKAHYNQVYFVACQYYRDEEIAKDIVQEVFILVFRKIKELRNPEAFSLWLRKITYSVCMNQGRRKMQIIDLGENKSIEDFKDHKGVSAAKEFENTRIKEVIFESLDTMSDSLKEVGLLRYYEGLQIEEIAELLVIPKGTVNSRLNRIRKKLQVDLKNQGISPNSYVFALSPMILQTLYREFSTRFVLNQQASMEILQSILQPKHIAKTAVLLKLLFGGAIGAGVIAGAIILIPSSQPTPVKQEPVKQEVVVHAKIKNITYNEAWTNKAVPLHVETTDGQYDEIWINGKKEDAITENGKHKVQLVSKGKVIDEKEIEISNIDIHSPNGTYKKEGDTFTYYLYDDASAIDSNSIRFYRDEQRSSSYTYDVENHILRIVSPGKSIDYFYISDYAGNELEIVIH